MPKRCESDDDAAGEPANNENDPEMVDKDKEEQDGEDDETSDDEEAARLIRNAATDRESRFALHIINGHLGRNAGGVPKELLEARLKEAKEAFVKYLQDKYARIKKYAKEHPYRFAAIVTLVVLACCAGPIAAAALSGVGFTAGGVAAGSLAAAWHSSIGLVAAGSAFATLQSLAATGAIIGLGYLTIVPLASWGIWKIFGGTPSDIDDSNAVVVRGEQPKPDGGGGGGENFFDSVKRFGHNTATAASIAGNTIAVGGMIVGAFLHQKFMRWMRG